MERFARGVYSREPKELSSNNIGIVINSLHSLKEEKQKQKYKSFSR